MIEISIDIKPFDCKYFRASDDYSYCRGYCLLGDDLSLKFCKGNNCEEYESEKRFITLEKR